MGMFRKWWIKTFGEVRLHNFLVLDRQPTGPDFSLTLPFQIRSSHPPNRELAEIRGNQIVYLKRLEDREVVYTPIQGFSESPKDSGIRIENTKAAAGMRIRGDRPLSSESLWSIRSVLAVEPFITMSITPGSEFRWETSYEYYTLTSK